MIAIDTSKLTLATMLASRYRRLSWRAAQLEQRNCAGTPRHRRTAPKAVTESRGISMMAPMSSNAIAM